jgi:pSer/pThr/pTyr-binding forkhead associated (FHA) protein
MPILMQIKDDVVQNKFPLEQKTVSIGRSTDNDIQLDDKTVSANHAWLEYHPADDEGRGEYFRLIDLQSTNGSFVNEEKITEKNIKHNDVLRIGFVSFKFIDENEHRFEETSKVHKSWIPGVYYTKD